MAITEDVQVFPNNIISLVKARVNMLDEDLQNSAFRRPLRPSDPTKSVGIFAGTWIPQTNSKEMLGRQNYYYTLNRYTCIIQAFVKDMDEERGLAVHSVLSSMLRDMLYADNILRVGLSSLSVANGGVTERAKRWDISNQRFMSNEMDNSFVYLSNLEFWLETEME